MYFVKLKVKSKNYGFIMKQFGKVIFKKQLSLQQCLPFLSLPGIIYLT